MSLNDRTKVSMPTDKITYKKGKDNIVYVYYTLRAYRRTSDGKPTSDEVAIGKKDLTTGMLIPNNKYYEIFKVEEDVAYIPKSILTYGTFYTLDKIAELTKLKGKLIQVFPEKWKAILTIAMYMLIKGNTVKYCEYWCSDNYNYLSTPIVSQRISELFENITNDERMNFFQTWSSSIIEDEYIAYDVTSISSYSNKISNVEYGYNRDAEDLPQINLGMFTGEKTKLPIFYNTYVGSITDKEQLIYMMKYASELGLKNIKYVMDKGFYKNTNLRYMHDKGHKFLICLSNSFNFAREYIISTKEQLIKPRNWDNEYQIYGYTLQYVQESRVANLHIIFNPDKQVDEQKILYSTIDRLKNELMGMKGLPLDTKKYDKYFDITLPNKDDRSKFTFTLNDTLVNKALVTTGYVVFLTTDLNLTFIDVLRIYRSKDIIEKSFDDLKNELDFSRLKTHLNRTTDGKMFVGFISLIMRMYFNAKLTIKKKDLKKTSFSVNEALLELEKIKVTTLANNKTIIMPLTKLQKDILISLDVNPNEVEKSLVNLN
jgi:transposase